MDDESDESMQPMEEVPLKEQRTSERAEVEVEDLGSQLVPRDAGIVQ